MSFDENPNKIYFIDPHELEIKHTRGGNTVHLAFDIADADHEKQNLLRHTQQIIDINMGRLAEIMVRIPIYHERNFVKYRFVECHVVESRHSLDRPHGPIGAPDLFYMRYELGFTCIYHDYQRSPVSVQECPVPPVLGLGNTFRQYRLGVH